METPNDTPVESTTKSLAVRDGNSALRLERVAALLSETELDRQSLENSEAVLILLSLLHGITEYTTSGNVLWLAADRAKTICMAAGVNEERFRAIMAKFMAYSKKARTWNPLAY